MKHKSIIQSQTELKSQLTTRFQLNKKLEWCYQGRVSRERPLIFNNVSKNFPKHSNNIKNIKSSITIIIYEVLKVKIIGFSYKIWYIPSPQGVFLVVIFRTLVGILTGPLTLRRLSLAPRTRSAHTVQHIKPCKIKFR